MVAPAAATPSRARPGPRDVSAARHNTHGIRSKPIAPSSVAAASTGASATRQASGAIVGSPANGAAGWASSRVASAVVLNSAGISTWVGGRRPLARTAAEAHSCTRASGGIQATFHTATATVAQAPPGHTTTAQSPAS